MDAHVERVTTAATAKCLALARLRGLRPKQMRQLYRSVVIPTTDYAASSWFSQDRRGISRLVNRLERVQKMGAKIILRAFNGVALRILEAEASLEPVRERLARKVAAHLASLTSLQESNLLRQCMHDIQRGATAQESPLQETWWAYKRQYSPRGGPAPIPLRTWIIPPWRDRADQCLRVEQDQARDFLERGQRYGTAILYTDASVRNGHRAARDLVVKEVKRRAEESLRETGLGTWGQYTQRLDAALPGKHTLKLYGSLDSDQAAVLVQARTNHTHLNSNLARLRVEEDAKCQCGIEDETVAHVLLRCPRWIEMRPAMKEAAGGRWGDLSYLLGGYSKKRELRTGKSEDGPMEKWAPNLEMVKITIRFLQQTTRMGATPVQGQSEERQG
ncbi:hypothetical protein D6D04_08719 [Aureobasidium pullulans]|nr:hypothetical protein D6D04_08719 [Aureobasidium pullulans]